MSKRVGETVRSELPTPAANDPRSAAAPPVWLITPTAGTAGVALVQRPRPAADANTPQEYFETLSQSDAARVYAGRLCLGDGVVLDLAVKAQRTERDGGAEADARWARAIELLTGTGERPPGMPDWFSPADDDVAPRVGPRLYCKFRQILFRPRSPASRHPLVTCRDDALLKARNLPVATQGGPRVLFAPADAAADAVRFYGDDDAAVGDGPAGPFGVDQLLRDQGQLPASREVLAEQNPRLHAELTDTHPCYTCPEAPRCYPAKGYAHALDRLMVVSFHDFHVLAAPRYDLQLDDYLDLLGGRPLAPWLEQLRGDPLPYTGQRRRALELLGGARLFLFEDDSAARRVVEIVTLKWAALAQTAAALRGLYHVGRPHGRLSARHALVRFPRPASDLPRAWAIEIGLIGLDRWPDAAGGSPRPVAAAEPLYDSGSGEGHSPLMTDLYALGVLVLRALWVNAERDLPQALAAARESAADGSAAAGADACRRMLQRAEWAWPNVLYRGSAAAQRTIATALEPALARALSLTLRMLSQKADLLPAGAEGGPEQQRACLDSLVDEFAGIRRELERTLFGLPADATAVAAVLRSNALAPPSVEEQE